jgi:hypothetical protein
MRWIFGFYFQVRGKIFSKLNQRQAVNLRLVCRQFRDDIDTLIDLNVDLDERSPHFQRVIQLRIKRCKILHLLEPPPLGPGTTILKHPNLLRTLHIRTDKISPENFHYILADCAEYIKEFSSLLTTPLLTHPFPPQLSYKFNHLLSLNLSLSSLPPEGGLQMGPPKKLQDNLFHQLLAHPMPHLKSFRVELRCIGFAQISRFSTLILSFISKHWKKLDNLDFDLITGHGMPSAEIRPLAESDVDELLDNSLLQKVAGLQAVRVVNSTAVGIDMWATLLSNQKKLEFLETDILPAPAALFKQIILNNSSTLVHVDIGDLTQDRDDTDEEVPFDLSVFQNCAKLKKLTLDRNTSMGLFQRRDRAHLEDKAQLINLFSLPESLQELAVNYFLVLSDELLILFSSQVGKRLKSLTLAQCGGSGIFGVDGTVLEKIVSLENIQFIEISPLNYSSQDERRKLNMILTAFGYHEDHSYIQLSRVAPSVSGGDYFQDEVDEDLDEFSSEFD